MLPRFGRAASGDGHCPPALLIRQNGPARQTLALAQPDFVIPAQAGIPLPGSASEKAGEFRLSLE